MTPPTLFFPFLLQTRNPTKEEGEGEDATPLSFLFSLMRFHSSHRRPDVPFLFPFGRARSARSRPDASFPFFFSEGRRHGGAPLFSPPPFLLGSRPALRGRRLSPFLSFLFSCGKRVQRPLHAVFPPSLFHFEGEVRVPDAFDSSFFPSRMRLSLQCDVEAGIAQLPALVLPLLVSAVSFQLVSRGLLFSPPLLPFAPTAASLLSFARAVSQRERSGFSSPPFKTASPSGASLGPPLLLFSSLGSATSPGARSFFFFKARKLRHPGSFDSSFPFFPPIASSEPFFSSSWSTSRDDASYVLTPRSPLFSVSFEHLHEPGGSFSLLSLTAGDRG